MLKIKHILLILLNLLFVMYGCSGKDKDFNYSLKGNLENLDSPYFYIATEISDSIMVDTVYVDRKGKFSYQGKVDGLTIASLYFNEKSWSTSVFLNEGWNVEIKGDINKPDLILVNGGNINDDLTAFKKENISLFENKANLVNQIAEEKNSDIIQNIRAELQSVDFELTNKAKSFIEKNPDKIASVMLIQDFFKNSASVESLEKELDLLTGEAENFVLTADLRRYSEKVKKSQVGALAPEIAFYKKDGDNIADSLKSYRGKYIVLTFASEEALTQAGNIFPMKKVYKEVKSGKTEFISLLVNYKPDISVSDSVGWKVYYDPRGWAAEPIKSYNIVELPYHVLISPDGYIIERGFSIVSLPQKIKDLQKGNDNKNI